MDMMVETTLHALPLSTFVDETGADKYNEEPENPILNLYTTKTLSNLTPAISGRGLRTRYKETFLFLT